jgi:hypothetical protein
MYSPFGLPQALAYFMFSIIRVANSLVFTLVAPCI